MKPLITENEERSIQAFNAALTHEKADTVILADVSGSMDQILPGVGHSRYQIMKHCLLRVVSTLQSAAVTLFSTNDERLTSWEAFDASRVRGNGTNLARALRSAAKLNPSHIIVITDGEPDSTQAALATASTMLCRVDVYYCGPGKANAVEFCRSLAQFGGQAIIDPECVTMIESVKLFLTDVIAA